MIESKTITEEQEKALLKEWFETTAFDEEYENTVPGLAEEEDDEGRSVVPPFGSTPDKLSLMTSEIRHLPGKHNQKTHGSGGGGADPKIVAAHTHEELSVEGQAAVAEAEKKYGVTREGMAREIESKLTDQNIAEGKAWYREAHDFNQDLAKRSGLSHEQVAAITAATSPRTPWPRNKLLAERVAMNWDKFPDTEPTFRDKAGKLDTPTQAAARKMGGGLVRNNLAPALVIARTKNGTPEEQKAVINSTLSGVKRRSFYNNMVDPENSTDITVDTWTMRAAMNSTTKPGGMSLEDANDFLGSAESITQGGAGYVSISESVRMVAKKRGLTPHEVQAAYWIAVAGSKDGARG